MQIRAGIIHPISYGKLSKLHKNEILYWSGHSKIIEVLMQIYTILTLNEEGYVAPVDFCLDTYFGEYTYLAEKYLSDVSDNIIAYYFYEYQCVMIENPISVWSKNTIGHQEERNTLDKFNNIYGYTIDSVRRREYTIPGTNITISGTPDGIVTQSPGHIFDGYLVEIKYQNNKFTDFILRNKCQISAYAKIFKKPVMLIILSNRKYQVFKYSLETLERFWEKEILPKLLINIREIHENLLITDPHDIPKYLTYLG